ncbi:hypothetical protein [Leptospira borgpetersenii]|uniref:hypothetical protein n=1 Tax=Leptospira borgpetersenii TaxID=174 RepID=UPI0030D452FF
MISELSFANTTSSFFGSQVECRFRSARIILSPTELTKSRSQNLKKNISKRSGKFLKNVRVPTETVVLKEHKSFS